jgi:hypothetical protein
MRASAAHATLHKCTITCKDPVRPASSLDAVHICEGASAQLVDSSFTAQHGSGVVIHGSGSRGIAVNCIADKCWGDGFKASGHGFLSAGMCTASGNAGSGFVAYGATSVVIAGPDCSSHGNLLHGFQATCGANMYMNTCSANSNHQCGALARGANTKLDTHNCTANSNGQYGFSAQHSATLTYSRRCTVNGSGYEDLNGRTGELIGHKLLPQHWKVGPSKCLP